MQVLPEAGQRDEIHLLRRSDRSHVHCLRALYDARFRRRNTDERSLGELFYLTIDELEDLHYLDALASLLSLMMDCAKEAEILDDEQINQLLDLFVAKLPDLWGKCLKQCA